MGRYRIAAKRAVAAGEKIEENRTHGGGGPRGGDLWKDEYLHQAARMASMGLTDADIADVLDISPKTFSQWRWTRPDLDEAMRHWRAAADDRVERRLYEKAIGYNYVEDKILVVAGEVIHEEHVVHVPPSDAAAIYWLQNRQPGLWKHEQDRNSTGLSDYERMSDDEILRIMAQSRAELGDPDGRPN